MKPTFQVMSITSEGNRAYVKVRAANPTSFAISQGSTLGGIRLRSFLEEPEAGNYVLQLESVEDIPKLTVGEVLELD
jgi:hypothetical protein